MANTKSAQKRNRQAQKRRARNTAVRSGMKTILKKAREAIATQAPEKAKEALVSAARALSKAATKGVIHKRSASRRISRLALRANKNAAAAAQA